MEGPSPENTQEIPPNEGEGIAGAGGGGQSPLPEPGVPKSPVEAVCRKSLESLPISSHREKIMTSIRNNRMTCIQGETGCGKSSMVPLFIVEEAVSFFDALRKSLSDVARNVPGSSRAGWRERI
jgi:hypothetical protein